MTKPSQATGPLEPSQAKPSLAPKAPEKKIEHVALKAQKTKFGALGAKEKK